MPWQYCFKREIAFKSNFASKNGGEDIPYMEEILDFLQINKFNKESFPKLEIPLYCYNYPREGSILGQMRKEKKKNGEKIKIVVQL